MKIHPNTNKDIIEIGRLLNMLKKWKHTYDEFPTKYCGNWKTYYGLITKKLVFQKDERWLYSVRYNIDELYKITPWDILSSFQENIKINENIPA